MKKLKATAAALCLILIILVFNVPDINYDQGPDHAYVPDYEEGYSYSIPCSENCTSSEYEVCDSGGGACSE